MALKSSLLLFIKGNAEQKLIFNNFRRHISNRKASERILIRNEDEEQQRPLAVIIGWGDSKMKKLEERYSSFFEKKNFATLLTTTSMFDNHVRYNSNLRKQAIAVKQEMMSLMEKNKQRLVMLYIFSSGTNLYSHLINEFNSSLYPRSNICGTIFDSCPIFPRFKTLKNFRRALVDSGNPILANIFALMAFIVLIKGPNDPIKLRNLVENASLPSPQLLLFSKDDPITPYQDVFDFIEVRKSKGINVTYKMWENSKHVKHILCHQQEYQKLVENFVDKCIENYSVEMKLDYEESRFPVLPITSC